MSLVNVCRQTACNILIRLLFSQIKVRHPLHSSYKDGKKVYNIYSVNYNLGSNEVYPQSRQTCQRPKHNSYARASHLQLFANFKV